MPNYQTADKIITRYGWNDIPLSIMVDPGTGNVQVQFQDATDAWYTPAAAEYTLTVADRYKIERANCPDMKIIVTGDAQFYVIGA